MRVHAYLTFSGNCEEAFRFYEKALGGKIEGLFKYGDSPMANQVGADWKDKIMHASLKFGESAIMGADAPPASYEKPQGISVSIGEPNLAEAKRMFHALAERGMVQMEFQQTFWAAGFGMLVDRFGIPWMVNCEQQPSQA